MAKRGRKKQEKTFSWLKPPAEEEEIDEVSKQSFEPDPHASVMTVHDVTGECTACKYRGSAQMLSYSDRTVLVRCPQCGKAGTFRVIQRTSFDPRAYKPSPFDEDNQE